MNAFLAIPQWPGLAAAKFLDLPELEGRSLVDFRLSSTDESVSSPMTLSELDIAQLKERGFDENQIEQFIEMQSELQDSRLPDDDQVSSLSAISQALVKRTGIEDPVWQRAGQEMLEAVLPLQASTTQELLSKDGEVPSDDRRRPVTQAREMGLKSLTLVTDFPVTTATFGFSRVEYQPDLCRLNPFPPDRDHGGKFPIYVDMVQADALILRLDADRVWTWLARNGYPPTLPPAASDQDVATQAYFISLLNDTPLRETLRSNRPHERLVFGLLHTLSHLAVRQAALLCGLDRTSLSEYVLPRALTFALYCNHRFGATIGALASMFEQSLSEWLQSLRNSQRCVYDPVCADKGGNCHACTHLAETSCRFFNLNLGRAFLFGGTDPELNEIEIGFFDVDI